MSNNPSAFQARLAFPPTDRHNPVYIPEIVIKLPMRPVLAHFAHWLEQGRVDDIARPVCPAAASPLGVLLDTVLTSKKNFLALNPAAKTFKPEGVLLVQLTATQFNRGDFFLLPEKEAWLDKMLYHLHRQMLLQHIFLLVEAGCSEKFAIEKWMRQLNFLDAPDNFENTRYEMLKKISTISRQKSGQLFQRGNRPKQPANPIFAHAASDS